jgi:hypothetical protein
MLFATLFTACEGKDETLSFVSQSSMVVEVERLFVVQGGQLAELNPRDASVKRVMGQGVGATSYLTGLAWDAQTQTLFASGFENFNPVLFTVDVETGAFTTKGASPRLDSLAVHPKTHVLYGLELKGWLHVLDKATGRSKQRMMMKTPDGEEIHPGWGMPFAHGLAFSPDGELYASTTIGAALHRLDLKQGTAEVVAPLRTGYVVSLAFDADGNLYGTTHQPTALIRIDRPSNTSVGSVTEIGRLPEKYSYPGLEFVSLSYPSD